MIPRHSGETKPPYFLLLNVPWHASDSCVRPDIWEFFSHRVFYQAQGPHYLGDPEPVPDHNYYCGVHLGSKSSLQF